LIENIDDRVKFITELLDDKKATDIEVFDLDGVDYIAQKVILSTSISGRHTDALLTHLKVALKTQNEEVLASDETDDWSVADLGDVLIHIMTPEYRELYSLETFLEELKTKSN